MEHLVLNNCPLDGNYKNIIMKSGRIITTIKTALYFIAFASLTVACDTGQGMMHGGNNSMNMGNWNWPLILISLGIGFLIGYLVARRRK